MFCLLLLLLAGPVRALHLHHQEVYRDADRQAVHRANPELDRRVFLRCLDNFLSRLHRETCQLTYTEGCIFLDSVMQTGDRYNNCQDRSKELKEGINENPKSVE